MSEVSNNLASIARYVVKGGNESLRYNACFGRDLAEDLGAKIWREGLGPAASEEDKKFVMDARGLNATEVKTLDTPCRRMMNRRNDKRSYLLTSSGR